MLAGQFRDVDETLDAVGYANKRAKGDEFRDLTWGNLPDRVGAARVAAIEAAWPSGRWFSVTEALGAGLPAPLRKLLESAGA